MRQFRLLEPLCWRAPSAHNTQPWRLTRQTGQVEVRWDPADALPAGDPTGRDLRLSLGCFVETCLVVAAGAGLRLRFEPDYSVTDHRVGWLRPDQQRYPTRFTAGTVRDRATHRGVYRTGPDPATLATVSSIARAAGGAVRALPGAQLRGLPATADRWLYAEPAVVRELRGWLRLSPRHPRYMLDGLTDRSLLLSGPEALALRTALAGHPALRRLGLPRLLAAASGDPLRRAGQVVVLTGPPELDEPGQIEFGRVLMRIWLTFTAAGLACHPLSQLIDAPATRAALADRLAVAPAQLLHITRVGVPAVPPPRSARRLVDAV
jgi:hypothetical protein